MRPQIKVARSSDFGGAVPLSVRTLLPACFLLVTLASPAARAQSTQNQAASRSPDAAATQQLLNVLGKPAAPSAWIAGLPDSYATWTDAQRNTAPRQIQGRCLVFWTMMNDAGTVNLLPPPQTLDDSSRLAVALCTIAHMPRDWPARAATLTDILRTLRRSTALGKPLVLPSGL
jgi:hypothetical protein